MKRIQRKRTRGWRMPPNTKYVGRPGKFGNPFDWRDYQEDYAVSDYDAHQYSVDDFRHWLDGDYNWWRSKRDWILSHLDDLREFDALACWCSLDQPCHVDVYIELLSE